MTAHPIQNLFDNVIDRQIADMPYLTADRRPSERQVKKKNRPTMDKIEAAMPIGEVVKFKLIMERSGLAQKTIHEAMARYPQEYKKVGHGKWVRL